MSSDSHPAHADDSSDAAIADGSVAAPVDEGMIRSTLVRAQDLRDTSLCTDELAELDGLLRGHIAVLLPEAQAATDKLWRGGMEWSRRTGRLSEIRFRSEQGLGAGRLSALVQINLLARDCEWLLADHKERHE
ncbi:DUF6415 family natural product biosynthesis protein [Streptomyces sp. 769]|nr:DUF6415 family natural product biosynthesis protein [Streptomyces sp. 769]AJC53650.1 hypothetical protein GZL_01046 [Streptomyces sp. 769]